ncbi:type II toxin-antitoxin system ParD family antitoxin [Methylomonas sp. CM2]|uniref:type II toxin-antitoxin system ParD family antitoxin n=1 Tax=Methylomonas sp. CM2 TaxID=3417647 RepID=UPI003CF55AEF
MAGNTSVTLGDHFDNFVQEKYSKAVRAGLRKLEEEELKLQTLRAKLQAGEDSLLQEDFDQEQFLASMRKKHSQ